MISFSRIYKLYLFCMVTMPHIYKTKILMYFYKSKNLVHSLTRYGQSYLVLFEKHAQRNHLYHYNTCLKFGLKFWIFRTKEPLRKNPLTHTFNPHAQIILKPLERTRPRNVALYLLQILNIKNNQFSLIQPLEAMDNLSCI